MNRQSKCVSLLILMCAGLAVAQEPQPTVAPFPLELRRMPSGFSKKEGEELQAEFRRLVRSAGAMVPNAGSMDSALLALKRQDCDRENECVQQLAQKAQTLYGLFASIDYDMTKNVVATGRVVRDDGKLIGELKTITIPKGSDPFMAVARVALVQLLSALKVKELPPFREAAVVEPVKPVDPVKPFDPNAFPPPPPPPTVTQPTETNLKTPGYVLLGVGGAVAVGGVLVFALANPRVDSNGVIERGSSTPAEAVAAYNAARTQQTVGLVMTGVGAAAAATGLVFVLLPPTKTVAVTAVPTSGGAMISVGGVFP